MPAVFSPGERRRLPSPARPCANTAGRCRRVRPARRRHGSPPRSRTAHARRSRRRVCLQPSTAWPPVRDGAGKGNRTPLTLLILRVTSFHLNAEELSGGRGTLIVWTFELGVVEEAGYTFR